MLGRLFKSKPGTPAEEIAKARQEWLDTMLQRSQRLSKLIHSDVSGWKEFCGLLEDYIDKVSKRKAITALDRASDAEIQQLKYIDHEIYILRWVLRVPQQFIDGVENEIKKENKEE